MPIYAIGDIQGSFEELGVLLGSLEFDGDKDRLWFVGDLVNRGPASLATLRFVRDLGERALAVLGNHDLHLLALAHGVVKEREDDTLAEVLAAPDRDELIDCLRGIDRLRLIVNAMTRLRFCTPEGVMEFRTKGETTEAPAGHLPWFDVPGRRSADQTVICGHWSALGLRIAPKLLALDSGCVWGGKLTAIRLEDRRLYQVPCAANAALVKSSAAQARPVPRR